jgi:hypothetical protein
MTRLHLLIVLLALPTAPIFAQPQQSQDQPPPLIPIAGRVVNDATGGAIAGAIVHYRGLGLSFRNTDLKIPYDPPSIHGEVTTGADGAYTTPPLPNGGEFQVHASAPGFLAAQQRLQALPENIRNFAPPGFPLPPNGTLRLRPDPLSLTPMSGSSLAAFALPRLGEANREFAGAAFSPDGNRLAFLTLDTFSPPLVDGVLQTPFRRCAIWEYNLKTGRLTGADDDRPGICDSPSLIWDGESFYIVPGATAIPAPTQLSTTGIHIQGSNNLGVRQLPPSVTQKLAVLEEGAAETQKLDHFPGIVTPNGHFSITVDTDGRSICGSLVVTDLQTNHHRTLGDACIEASFLTSTGDIVLYNDARMGRSGRTNRIVAYDFRSGASRSFNLPDADNAAALLASHALANGAARIAYSIQGDCDPAATDYSQPFQPDGVLGQTPNQFSVCFITLPAPDLSTGITRK